MWKSEMDVIPDSTIRVCAGAGVRDNCVCFSSVSGGVCGVGELSGFDRGGAWISMLK
jgi:hypothetical protein